MTHAQNRMPDLGRIIDYETGQLGYEDTLILFQDLVDSGLAWQLQGHYGRTALNLMEAGLIRPPNDVELLRRTGS